MSHWQRPGYRTRKPWDSSQLLPFQIVLGPKEWYSIHRPGSPNREFRFGEDTGGMLRLTPELNRQLVQIQLFKRYVLERRAIDQLFTGIFDRITDLPVFAEPGMAYHPQGISPDNYGRLGVKYEVVISFATAKEAATFRIMFSNIL
jgi:hypothetical protein